MATLVDKFDIINQSYFDFCVYICVKYTEQENWALLQEPMEILSGILKKSINRDYPGNKTRCDLIIAIFSVRRLIWIGLERWPDDLDEEVLEEVFEIIKDLASTLNDLHSSFNDKPEIAEIARYCLFYTYVFILQLYPTQQQQHQEPTNEQILINLQHLMKDKKERKLFKSCQMNLSELAKVAPHPKLLIPNIIRLVQKISETLEVPLLLKVREGENFLHDVVKNISSYQKLDSGGATGDSASSSSQSITSQEVADSSGLVIESSTSLVDSKLKELKSILDGMIVLEDCGNDVSMTQHGSLDVSSQESVTVMSQESVTVTSQRSGGMGPVKVVDMVPVINGDVTPQRNVDVVPHRNGDVAPNRNVNVIPHDVAPKKNNVDVTPQRNVDVTPQRNVDVAPQRNVDVAPQRNVDVAPQRNVDVTPLRGFESVPQKNVDVTPQRNSAGTPFRNVEMTPYRNVEMTPYRNVETTPFRNVEMTPYRNIEMRPYRNVDVPPIPANNVSTSSYLPEPSQAVFNPTASNQSQLTQETGDLHTKINGAGHEPNPQGSRKRQHIPVGDSESEADLRFFQGLLPSINELGSRNKRKFKQAVSNLLFDMLEDQDCVV